jgi:hypothetical protein
VVAAHSPEVHFKPILLPAQFADPNGTPVFALNAKYALPGGLCHPARRRKCSDDVYRIAHCCGSLRAVVSGRTEIFVADGQVLIDITKGNVGIIPFHR